MPLSDFIWSVQTHTNGIKRKISGDACSQQSLVNKRFKFFKTYMHAHVYMSYYLVYICT